MIKESAKSKKLDLSKSGFEHGCFLSQTSVDLFRKSWLYLGSFRRRSVDGSVDRSGFSVGNSRASIFRQDPRTDRLSAQPSAVCKSEIQICRSRLQAEILQIPNRDQKWARENAESNGGFCRFFLDYLMLRGGGPLTSNQV